jgi:hypothetical protein
VPTHEVSTVLPAFLAMFDWLFGRPFLTTLCLRPVWLAKAHPLVPPGGALIWAVLKRAQLYGLQHIGSFTGSCITFPRFCQSLTCFIDASFTASELPDTPKAGHHRPAFSFCGDDAQVVEPCSSLSTLSVTSTGIRLLFLSFTSSFQHKLLCMTAVQYAES